jgi:hypothetical protein
VSDICLDDLFSVSDICFNGFSVSDIYLDGLFSLSDMILNVAMEQYFDVQKTKDKTVHNKPLKKLHEKAFTEVVSNFV